MGNSIISIENLERYWNTVKDEKPKLFKNRNNSKRNDIAAYILDLWEDENIYSKFGKQISEQKFYEEKALTYSLNEYNEILDFVNNKDRQYCVYIWRYWKNGKPFYVGKGKKYRARNKNNRNKHFLKIVENNHCFYEIYIDNLTEIDALKLENDLINNFKNKGYHLVNLISKRDSRSII